MQSVALTVAGSDPSGGAGIQADLKTFHQFGVYGEAVVTLLTVQNTQTVARVETVPGDFVSQQLEAVLDDIPPHAGKTGALGSVEIVLCVAELAARFRFPLVVDPVMISKHGMPLISQEAGQALALKLLPYATVVTPNIPEAEVLANMLIQTEADIAEAADRILALGPEAVLIKGGHSAGDPIDYLRFDGKLTRFPGERVHNQHTHGTGCTYSAAITAGLALGYELDVAIGIAREYIQEAIETAPRLGKGVGPINHFATVKRLGKVGV